MISNNRLIQQLLQLSAVGWPFLGCYSIQSNTVQHSKFNSYDYSYSIIIFTVKSCSHYHQFFCAVPLQFLAGLHTNFYIKTNYRLIQWFLQLLAVGWPFLGCYSIQSNIVQHSRFNSYDYSYSIIIFTVKSCSHYHQFFCAVPLQFLAGLHTDFYIKTNYS